jgi:hypothetical protein
MVFSGAAGDSITGSFDSVIRQRKGEIIRALRIETITQTTKDGRQQ